LIREMLAREIREASLRARSACAVERRAAKTAATATRMETPAAIVATTATTDRSIPLSCP